MFLSANDIEDLYHSNLYINVATMQVFHTTTSNKLDRFIKIFFKEQNIIYEIRQKASSFLHQQILFKINYSVLYPLKKLNCKKSLFLKLFKIIRDKLGCFITSVKKIFISKTRYPFHRTIEKSADGSSRNCWDQLTSSRIFQFSFPEMQTGFLHFYSILQSVSRIWTSLTRLNMVMFWLGFMLKAIFDPASAALKLTLHSKVVKSDSKIIISLRKPKYVTNSVGSCLYNELPFQALSYVDQFFLRLQQTNQFAKMTLKFAFLQRLRVTMLVFQTFNVRKWPGVGQR